MRNFSLIGLLVGTLFLTNCVIDNPSGPGIALPVQDNFCTKGSFEVETGTITTTINYYTSTPVSKMFFECETWAAMGIGILDDPSDFHSGRMNTMIGGWTVTFTTCEMGVYGISGPCEYMQLIDVSDNSGIVASGELVTYLIVDETVYLTINLYE